MSFPLPNFHLKYWIAFSYFPKIGPIRLQRLLNYFSSLENAFKASLNELIKAGLEENVASEFMIKRQEINLNEILEKLDKEKIQVLTLEDQNYPPLLKEIYNPPPLLYYQGILKKEEYTLAVVGTRQLTAYGKQVTPYLVKELAQNGITIVSGLALGIDSLAHQSTIEVNGRTIGVLGGGLDKQSLYPSQNRYLVQKILGSGGLILSEYPPLTLPLPYHFPYRNRLISGLSLGTLIIEAKEDSGALITAQYALEQNREVFAIPGNIFQETSLGPNRLIKMGAHLVTSALDILEVLNLKEAVHFIQTREIMAESQEEELLLKFLSFEPIHIDQLKKQTTLEISLISSTLLIMEMKGKVRNLGGMNYVRAR